MSESPVEHFEHAEHAALLGDPFLTQVAVTIAILAVIAATVGSLETLETAAAIGDKNAAVLLQNKATDGLVTSAAGLPSVTFSRTIRDDQN
jgi:hypothetical protein